MKVLIVGSTHDSVVASMRDEFMAACRELGAALAQAGIDIVVGSDSTNAADRYVIEGMVTVAGRHRVWMLRPDCGETLFADRLAEVGGRIEVFQRRVRGSWSAGRVPQILAADAVLLIGGAGGTLTAGYVAPALERPVVAIASFGGAAAKLWPDLEPYYNRLGELSHQVGNLRERWKPNNAELAVRVIQELIKRRVFKTKPRLPIGIYMGCLVLCLIAWVYLFSNPLVHASYSFFSMLGLAGLLGTVLRNNLRMVFDPTATFSWNELLIEVGAGLLLGFSLALLYLVGSLTVTGKTEAILIPDSTEAFQRVAVVMTLLGLGGGLMIEQAANRVRSWFVERLASSED
jgi:hypothetical protein